MGIKGDKMTRGELFKFLERCKIDDDTEIFVNNGPICNDLTIRTPIGAATYYYRKSSGTGEI